MKTPKNIDDYLAGVPEKPRAALESLRRAIHAAAPDVVEVIRWGMPAFQVGGRSVAGFAAFKAHCSYFPFGHEVLEELRTDLEGLDMSKGTIRFPFDKPLRRGLVAKLVKARIRQYESARRRR
jgi:uncharacterized protein YdhG (YjbR/CyaY superfamily)